MKFRIFLIFVQKISRVDEICDNDGLEITRILTGPTHGNLQSRRLTAFGLLLTTASGLIFGPRGRVKPILLLCPDGTQMIWRYWSLLFQVLDVHLFPPKSKNFFFRGVKKAKFQKNDKYFLSHFLLWFSDYFSQFSLFGWNEKNAGFVLLGFYFIFNLNFVI